MSPETSHLNLSLKEIESKQSKVLENNRYEDTEGFKRSHSIKVYTIINAPKKKVWQALTNLEAYPTWNRFMVRAESTLEKEENIKFKVHMDGKFPIYKSLKILERDDEERLCWGGKVMGPGFHVKRCFFLKELSPTKAYPNRTLYYTYERFAGFMARFMFKVFGPTVRRGFELESECLKNTY